jgi:hypothetical protein
VTEGRALALAQGRQTAFTAGAPRLISFDNSTAVSTAANSGTRSSRMSWKSARRNTARTGTSSRLTSRPACTMP